MLSWFSSFDAKLWPVPRSRKKMSHVPGTCDKNSIFVTKVAVLGRNSGFGEVRHWALSPSQVFGQRLSGSHNVIRFAIRVCNTDSKIKRILRSPEREGGLDEVPS